MEEKNEACGFKWTYDQFVKNQLYDTHMMPTITKRASYVSDSSDENEQNWSGNKKK